MDIVTIQRTGKQIECRYAAPSISTGRFVACVIGETPEQIREDFTDPGTLTVHNAEDLYADKTYEGYTTIDEIRPSDGDYVIVMGKGG